MDRRVPSNTQNAASEAREADNAQSPAAAAAPVELRSPIRVILADTQAIFRVGIRKILALEDDLRVVAQAENLPQTLSAVSKHPADVLLFDSRVTPLPGEAVTEILKRAPTLCVVVLTPEANEQETVEYLRRGARGLVTRSIDAHLLVRCIRKVASGETWLDNRGVNWVIQAYRAQAELLMSAAPKGRLNEKELRIISSVTQGMRNKEIAQEIGTSEQVIKNYLRKIYDKLGISDRLELALYCVHHRLLERRGPQPAVLPPAEPSNSGLPAGDAFSSGHEPTS